MNTGRIKESQINRFSDFFQNRNLKQESKGNTFKFEYMSKTHKMKSKITNWEKDLRQDKGFNIFNNYT